ncbi:phosphoribosyltransferase-like protein [Microbacterium maritypicum]|uniref:Uncharacterized protein n=1 Tax=Microbacterium maritypicum TaxID=33918 RepID=A0ACD4B4P3_MICMQ|nr:hypothetical protein [Microbacterium liquefaciens]UTT52635.1 hypothetical protein NMQ05_16370 [Microbacterium liquefaciens]
MRLSTTSRATDWLDQFEIDDREGAITLLDAVRFVPGGEVVTGLRGALERFISHKRNELPVALVPILSDEDIDRDDESAPATVFVNFDPAQPIANNPGSEALIAQLIGELRRSSFASSILEAPLTLNRMKASRVRTLVCVTDYVGSGQQALDYVAAWYRNGTIKSWCSFGWLKIVVIAYAATVHGKRAIDSSRAVDYFDVLEIVPGLTELRHADPSGKAEEVCTLYARRGKVKPALGYKGSAGLFASSFSVPNNLPAILIKRSNRWTPFFDGRSVPVELAEQIGNYRPEADLPGHLEQAGQMRLAARKRDGHLDDRWETFIGMLGLLPRTDEEMSLKLGLDLQTTREMYKSLEGLELVGTDRRVTAAGRRALASHRRKPRRGNPRLTADTSPYYPRYSK